MGEILREWLSERLKENFTWEEANFSDMMKDGNLVARLLLSYKVISHDDYLLVQPTSFLNEIAANWRHLAAWLTAVDIELDKSEIKDMCEGRGSAILKLFYQLFLNLDNKDRIDFIKRERMLVSNLVTKLGNRFDVEKVDEVQVPVIDYLAKPLVDEKYFLEWQKKKSEQLKLSYDLIKKKYQKTIEKMEEDKMAVRREPAKPFKLSTDKKDIDMFERKYPCKYDQFTYEELLEMDQKAKEEVTTNILDEEWAKKYMENLQDMFSKKCETRNFQKQISKSLSNAVWEHVLNEEEEQFDQELAEKIMKLSHYEKQMCTQLMETKQQTRNVIRNRREAESDFSAQREHQFGEFLDDIRNQMHMELVEIDVEKQRQDDLHRKLYAEKIKRKRKHYYEQCYETVLALVDYAVKNAHVRAITESEEVDPYFVREWKNLFYKNLPIFDIIDEVEQTLEMHELTEATEVESVIHLEIERQDIQNENDFLDYHNVVGSWDLEYLMPHYEPQSEDRMQEYLGIRVLGQVVHNLLEIKYPPPPPKQPADLPKYTSKAILRCLPDRSITVPMQVLLNERKIHVVRLEAAINFCLTKYKMEMIGSADIDISYGQFITLASASDTELLNLLKSEGEDKLIQNFPPTGLGGIINTKQTQTPKTIPEEDMTLSTGADLGKYAYETLCAGEALTDHLICAIIVEYLKSIDDIEGFVIINYPNTYRQAQILEETITGRSPPDIDYLENPDDVFLESTLAAKSVKEIIDPYREMRKSRILPDPRIKPEDLPFVSYFTAYIHLVETQNILDEYYIWDKTSEEVIDRYYTSQYTNYSIYYEEINKDVLAVICKFIIGDFVMPIKDPDSLFGIGALSALDFPCSADKRSKAKIVKNVKSPITSNTKMNKIGTHSTIASQDSPTLSSIHSQHSMEFIKLASEMSPEIQPESGMCLNFEDEIVPPIPGEEDWVYADLPILESMGITLATVWEATEHAYISDLEKLFFAKRLQMNTVVPYTRFIKDKVRQIVDKPSAKPELVMHFQRRYNDFDDDWRSRQLSKVEWHCRIRELQAALHQICDERKKAALAERLRLILDNWTMEEVTVMANTFISCMQSELNRFIMSFQLLHDYYNTVMKKPTTVDRLSSKELTKVNRDTDDSPRSKRSEDKMFSKIKVAYQGMQVKNIMIDHSNNPYNPVLDNNFKTATKIIKDLHAQYQSMLLKEYAEQTKIAAAPPAKPDKLGKFTNTENIDTEALKVNMVKSVEEWTAAVDGEMQRACMRLQLLLARAHLDLELFNSFVSRAFIDIEGEVNAHYLREIEAVDRLCELVRLAVERGERIQDSLVLEMDHFYVDPNVKQFPEMPPPPPSPVVEREVDGEFRIKELAVLRDQLKLIAPTGIIIEQNLVYVLQDFLLLGKETCGASLPSTWTSLEPEQIPELSLRLFGETAYVDWRDLLIYCLDLRFPDMTELLQLRSAYREMDECGTELISRDQFMRVPMWFQDDLRSDDPQLQLRVNLMKVFLSEMFATSCDTVNYSAMLLAFCKAEDPRLGFAAAVAIAVDREVCWCWELCGPAIRSMIELKEYQEACRACALDCANKFADVLLDNVIQECEGIIITEVPVTPDATEGKRVKGKAGKIKAKHDKSSKLAAKEKGTDETKTGSPGKGGRPAAASPQPTAPAEEERPSQEEVPGEGDVPEGDERSAGRPDLLYCVSEQVVWCVLRRALPWQFGRAAAEGTPHARQVRAALAELARDTASGEVYVARFLEQASVLRMLDQLGRFRAASLLRVAGAILKSHGPIA